MRDLLNCLDLKRGVSPAAAVNNADTPFVSQIFDMQGQCGAMFAIICGAITDANVTFTVLAEEGDAANLSDNTAVDDADLNGTELLATPVFGSDDKVFKLGFRASGKRYKRVTITPSGNNNGDIYLAGLWIGCPLIMPPANPPA